MWFTRGLGGGDREAGMLDADAWREQEQLVDALEGGPQRRGLAEVADDALGALGRSRGASGIAHEDANSAPILSSSRASSRPMFPVAPVTNIIEALSESFAN
jgi:hypothetical protein